MAPPTKVRPATTEERVDQWFEAFSQMQRRVEAENLGLFDRIEVSDEALAIAAATLVSGGGGAPMVAVPVPRAEYEEVANPDGGAPRKVRPAGAVCGTCGEGIEPKDQGSWNESQGYWTHTKPTCLIPGAISGNIEQDAKDILAGREPSVPLA